MTTYYVPLEPYRERYTMQLSAKDTGWWERNLKKAGVNYVRVEGPMSERDRPNRPIEDGVVLDPQRRAMWGFKQTEDLIWYAKEKRIKDDDVIYFDDFWHPGFEMIPYTFQQLGVKPKMYAFCHAQSVDEYDFTYPMRCWMRDFERGIGKVLNGVFVSCPSMREALAQVVDVRKVYPHGHVWSTEEVMERMPVWYRQHTDRTFTGVKEGIANVPPRKNQIVFSSRWDEEKDPLFFTNVAAAVKETMPEAKFVVCTSSPRVRSNSPGLLDHLHRCVDLGLVELRENLTKEEYYATLCESKVQFNCSLQDWVSYVLLEASAAGCYPVYPCFRSFPETLWNDGDFLYKYRDVSSAADLVKFVLRKDHLWTRKAIEDRAWIHRRFDSTWLRMLQTMGVYADRANDIGRVDVATARDAQRDPFAKEDWF